MLSVLDEADSLQNQLTEPKASLSREQLLMAVQGLHTAHTPEILDQAVAAYIDRKEATAFSMAPHDATAVFGWKRPQTEKNEQPWN